MGIERGEYRRCRVLQGYLGYFVRNVYVSIAQDFIVGKACLLKSANKQPAFSMTNMVLALLLISHNLLVLSLLPLTLCHVGNMYKSSIHQRDRNAFIVFENVQMKEAFISSGQDDARVTDFWLLLCSRFLPTKFSSNSANTSNHGLGSTMKMYLCESDLSGTADEK